MKRKKNNNSNSKEAYLVVCCSYQSDRRIWVCISHQSNHSIGPYCPLCPSRQGIRVTHSVTIESKQHGHTLRTTPIENCEPI